MQRRRSTLPSCLALAWAARILLAGGIELESCPEGAPDGVCARSGGSSGALDNAAGTGSAPLLQGEALPSTAMRARDELVRMDDVILFIAMMVPFFAVSAFYAPHLHKKCAALESTASGAQELSSDAAEPGVDTETVWQVLAKGKWLWIPKILNGLHDGLLMPINNFIIQDFFARRRAGDNGLHCGLTPDEPHCREAVMDAMHVSMVIGCIAPAMSVLFGPAIGIFSDHMGRRRILVVCAIAGFISELFLILNVQFGTSLYIHLCLSPLGRLPVEPVWFAWTVDTIANPTLIGPCLITLGAIGALTGLVAMPIGYSVTMEMAALGAFMCSVLCTIGQIFFLPESLPPEKRRSWDQEKGAGLWKVIHAALPWNGIGIMFRGAMMRRLCILCIISSLADGGLTSCIGAFMGKYMLLDKAASYVLGITLAVSAILWQGAMGLMTRGVNEIMVLLWTRLLIVLNINGVCLLARGTWQASAWTLVLGGVPGLTATAFVTLCSRLVGEHEQGEMNAASAAIVTVSKGLGPLIFTPIFESTNQGGARTMGSNLFVIVGNLFFILVVLGSVTLPDKMARAEADHRENSRGEPCHTKPD